jgi:LacI family transcriptional regulator
VRCDIAGFGQAVAATILAWVEGDVTPPAEDRPAVDLVIRASSAAQPSKER